jgi:two-component system, cell cycle response regulator DivK
MTMVALRNLQHEAAARAGAPRVLIVEDDPGSRWALCALMKRLGYDCQTATNGREALELAGSFAPQAILMDVRLPVLDGLEATRQLKADARTRGIPVLALTGYTSLQRRQAMHRAGCVEVLAKPIVVQELLDRLTHHLPSSRPAPISP